MNELKETESMDEQEILNKLTELEEKLNKLREFSKKSEELRSARKRMVENLGDSTSSKRNIFRESKSDTKRVQFSEDSGSKERELRKPPETFLTKAQKSNSLYNLLTSLNNWQEEAKNKKSEIEMLKTIRRTVRGPEEIIGHDEKIKMLELENDELSDEILHFLFENMKDGKEVYQELIQHLEDENKTQEDTIFTLSEQVRFLKENNRALMWENDDLRQNQLRLKNNLSHEDLERTYRHSVFARKSSAFFPETNMFFTFKRSKSTSEQMLLDLELEERLSLDKESVDSFTLDNQIVNWKLDEESMQNKLKRLEQEHHEMEVIQMNLNLVKRYVRKHGGKQLNKDTFIDNCNFIMDRRKML